VLIAMVTSTYSGQFCVDCARKIYRRTMLVNLTLRWCSIASIFFVPLVTIHNVSGYRRIKRQFRELDQGPSSPASADAQAIQSLPWSSLIGLQDMGVGSRPLTLPIVAVGSTGLALGGWVVLMVIAAVLTMIGPLENPPAMPAQTPAEIHQEIEQMTRSRHLLYRALPIVLIAFAASVYWNYRCEHRRGSAPDVLGELFPTPAILQVGRRVHLIAFGTQLGPRYRIALCAQNLYDQTTALEATLDGLGAAAPLACELLPQAVFLCFIDCPLPPISQRRVLNWCLHITSRGQGGSRVRPAQRSVLSSKARDDAFDLATALAGGGGSIDLSRADPQPGVHFVSRQGRVQTLLLPHRAPTVVGQDQRSWLVECVWDPQACPSTGTIARPITEVLQATN
jgi:hypothetical protein